MTQEGWYSYTEVPRMRNDGRGRLKRELILKQLKINLRKDQTVCKARTAYQRLTRSM